jgi:hypothetical protein
MPGKHGRSAAALSVIGFGPPGSAL